MPYTLLLADDSITIQRVIELTFASEDITVVAFSDGEQAIASVDRMPPDIVLADVGMPGRSGYEVSRHIKRTPALAHIPVLLLTGAFEPVDQAKVAEAGCDGLLIKPFEPQVVISRVKELLRKPKPGANDPEVESYFEELDRAFANLATMPPAPRAPASPVAEHDPTPMDRSPATRAPLVEAFAALLTAERSQSNADDGEPDSSTGSGSSRAQSRDQQAALPTAFGTRVVMTDELIERVSRRVLEHLSDAVVRETVTDMVHATVERLVGEEIERIKSNIK
jgi:CheY-like chemotaxis protein